MTEWSDDRNQIQARVLEDSISPRDTRLTTIEATIHRFMLPELNTHRVFSRNSASSRAIPVSKQIEKVERWPAFPESFPAEQKGMQGGAELSPVAARQRWQWACNDAVTHARNLVQMGVHKSVVNRILEPFMWHTVIITATDWDGFWKQRCSPLAQPEIMLAAQAMKDAYDASEPKELEYGQWHTPLIQPDEDTDFWMGQADIFYERNWNNPDKYNQGRELRKKVSAARCARVSYLTHAGERSIEADLELYDRLTSADPPHWSPLEHVATPCEGSVMKIYGKPPFGRHKHQGNFMGWDQLRHMAI